MTDIYASHEMLFNHIVSEIIKQGQPSVHNQTCAYRLQMDGKVLRCAVGVCITDEEYDPDMESKGVTNLLKSFPGTLKHLRPFNDMLRWLQRQHDNIALDEDYHRHGLFVEEFKNRCRDYAASQGWEWKHG